MLVWCRYRSSTDFLQLRLVEVKKNMLRFSAKTRSRGPILVENN
jgi:hypothetical protein